MIDIYVYSRPEASIMFHSNGILERSISTSASLEYVLLSSGLTKGNKED
jgi:hypothetical protein